MRARREDRRQEDESAPARSAAGARADCGRRRFRPRPGGCGLPSAPGRGSRRPAGRVRRPARARTRSNSARRSAGGKAIVAEDDPGAARQPLQRGPERLALPLVGHQPEARQRLAAVHRASYSSRMSEASPESGWTRSGADRPAARLARREAGRGDADRRLQDPAAGGDRAADRGGQRVFGENRVQEAQAKWPALRSASGSSCT
jgi:hypothetical protein